MRVGAIITGPQTVRRRTLIGGITALFAFSAAHRDVRADDPAVLRIGGTGMALATMGQIGDAFLDEDHAATVKVLSSLGTSGGLSAAAAGAIDLSLAARPLKDADRAKGLQAFAYARTPIAFVTHPATGVHAVTVADVADIFAVRKQTWPDGTPIRLIRRDPSDADWTMLRSLSLQMQEAAHIALERPGLLTAATDQDNADALERLPGSFGVMSIAQIQAEARGVVPLILDGTPPTVDAVLAGQYPLSRTLYVAWRDPPSPEIARFLAFLHSDRTTEILTRLGHIALAGHTA
jgi:phosphate transport system substrate-binding protein